MRVSAVEENRQRLERRKMRKSLLLLLVLAGLLLSACGPIDIEQPPQTTEPSKSAPTRTTATPTQSSVPSTPAVTDYSDLIAMVEDSKGWLSFALTDRFDIPEDIDLSVFLKTEIEPFSLELTQQERSLLSGAFPDLETRKVARITADEVDELLTKCFGLVLEQTEKNGMENFVYLKETDAYYRYADKGVNWFVVDSVEERDDGTVSVYYAHTNSTEPRDYVAVFKPHEEGWWLCSNSRYVDNTGKTEAQIEMEALFDYYDKKREELWYHKTLSSDYATPGELSLRCFFDGGFSHNDEPTAEEWAALKDKPGFHEMYGFFRLPAEKMNEKLEEYFDITLDQMSASAFDGLEYLASTNCYYFMTTGTISVGSITAEKVEEQADGTIHLYYFAAHGRHLAVLKPVGERYLICSNLPV